MRRRNCPSRKVFCPTKKKSRDSRIPYHDIVAEDLRIMYSFSGEKSKELSEKNEADSMGDILVMLDTTPDKEMLEEGVAREVINRVQKLRKSAGLKVNDKVTMY